MRSGRWILAVATIPRGHRSCTSLFACAFIRLPQAIRLASATSHHNHHPQQQQQKQQKQQHQGCARLSTKPITQPGVRVMTRAKMLSSVVPQDVEGNVDGECWCGHELFNTVTTEWVQDHLHDPEVALVDIRGRVNKHQDKGSDFSSTVYEGMKRDYLDAHIPGAVFVDWTKDIAGVDENGVPAQLADRDTFVFAMEERGVGGDKRVVVYDNGDMLFATRFWWAMRRFGHDRVSVMDGGWAKWMAENRDITPDSPCPLKVHVEWTVPAERERRGISVSAPDVRAALGEKGSVQLLDARAAEQFTGEVRRARRGGHIPGAVNTPYREFLAEESAPEGSYRVFKGLADIEKVFHSANVDTSASAPPVIAYCNGGVASTLVLFLLYQLHQREHSTTEKNNTSSNASDGDGDRAPWANYDGSWNEWGNDEEAPVER
ncbi:unnamed protein product [Ascophyllum nodosum]